jgi:cobaltochelatase CobT
LSVNPELSGKHPRDVIAMVEKRKAKSKPTQIGTATINALLATRPSPATDVEQPLRDDCEQLAGLFEPDPRKRARGH